MKKIARSHHKYVGTVGEETEGGPMKKLSPILKKKLTATRSTMTKSLNVQL